MELNSGQGHKLHTIHDTILDSDSDTLTPPSLSLAFFNRSSSLAMFCASSFCNFSMAFTEFTWRDQSSKRIQAKLEKMQAKKLEQTEKHVLAMFLELHRFSSDLGLFVMKQVESDNEGQAHDAHINIYLQK